MLIMMNVVILVLYIYELCLIFVTVSGYSHMEIEALPLQERQCYIHKNSRAWSNLTHHMFFLRIFIFMTLFLIINMHSLALS